MLRISFVRNIFLLSVITSLLVACGDVESGRYIASDGAIVKITTQSPAAFSMTDNKGRCVLFWKKIGDKKPTNFSGLTCPKRSSGDGPLDMENDWRADIITKDRRTFRFQHLNDPPYTATLRS